ncbi:oligosaccharide flippase family protein [Nocardioides marmoraquaticus]
MTTAMIGHAVPAFIALLTGPVLAQSLGVEGRGEVAAASAPMTLAVTVATFGIPEAVTYAVARSPRALRHAAARGTALLTVAGLLAMAAVVAGAPALSDGDADVETLLLIASLAIVPNLLVGVLRGMASALQRWDLVTAERVLAACLRLGVLVPFWLTDTLTPLIAVLAVACTPIAGALVYTRVLVLAARNPAELTPDAQVRALAGYGGRVWIGSLSGILLSRVDQTLMTPLGGTVQLGLYVVAVSISELPLIINTSVREVTFVTDARDSADDRLTASARVSTLLSAIVGVGVGVTMVAWVPFLFGRDFAAALPVAAILLVAVVLGTPGSIGGSGLSARGRPELRSWSLVIACVVNVVLLVLLVPRWGAVGAAVATLVGNITASNLNLMFVSRVLGVPVRQFYGFRRSDVVTVVRFGGRLLDALPGFGKARRR